MAGAARDVAGQGGRGQITRAFKAMLRDADFILRVVKIHWNVLSKRVIQSDTVVVSFSRSFGKYLGSTCCVSGTVLDSPWRGPCPIKAHGSLYALGPARFLSIGSKARSSIPQ